MSQHGRVNSTDIMRATDHMVPVKPECSVTSLQVRSLCDSSAVAVEAGPYLESYQTGWSELGLLLRILRRISKPSVTGAEARASFASSSGDRAQLYG